MGIAGILRKHSSNEAHFFAPLQREANFADGGEFTGEVRRLLLIRFIDNFPLRLLPPYSAVPEKTFDLFKTVVQRMPNAR